MEYNRSLPWTTRFCSHTNDLFIRTLTEIKRSVDNAVIQKGILSKSQLDLVYSILAGVALAAVYFVLPPPVGGLIALSVLGLEWAKPDLFSQRTWAILQMGGALYGVASTSRILILAYKIDSGIFAAYALFIAAGSMILAASYIDRLLDPFKDLTLEDWNHQTVNEIVTDYPSVHYGFPDNTP